MAHFRLSLEPLFRCQACGIKGTGDRELGIAIERIKPGDPQQNSRHERMHLTLKLETTKPAAKNFLQQQARFDDFIVTGRTRHSTCNAAQRYRPSERQC